MTPEELRAAINKYLDKGPDFLKYGGTSHFSRPTFIGFSPAAQKVLVEETHKRGRAAETHSTIEGLRLSIEAGIDLIQHPDSPHAKYPASSCNSSKTATSSAPCSSAPSRATSGPST